VSLGVGGLLGTVEGVPAGVVLPGAQGFATVAEVPLGRDGLAEATVELELLPVPLLVVVDVMGVVVEAVLLGAVVVEVPVPALVLLDGVQGATVVVVSVWFCVLPVVPPVTDPALPATRGVPCVTAGLPVELGLGCEVGRVPTELGCVDPGFAASPRACCGDGFCPPASAVSLFFDQMLIHPKYKPAAAAETRNAA